MTTEYVLGHFGLFLLLLVVKLSDRADGPHHSFAGGVSGYVARRMIDAISVVGWLADRLPESAPSHPPHPLPDRV